MVVMAGGALGVTFLFAPSGCCAGVPAGVLSCSGQGVLKHPPAHRLDTESGRSRSAWRTQGRLCGKNGI